MPGLDTLIDDRAFRLWFKYYARISMSNGDTTCPRQKCNATIDKYGDLLLEYKPGFCFNTFPRIWRHDAKVRRLARVLRRATP